MNDKGQVIANLLKTAPPDFELNSVLVRINPKTGAYVLVSDFNNPDQGAVDPGRFATDLAIERNGKILAGTANSNDVAASAIFRINPSTGKRKLLSDFADAAQGPVASLSFSNGLATESSRQILVATVATGDGNNNIIGGNYLMRIDRKTGQRTILSDFDNPAQGILAQNIRGALVEESGKIIVSAAGAVIGETTLFFRVNPKTGKRVVLSDSSNLEQGPPISTLINYLAIVPNDDDAEDED